MSVRRMAYAYLDDYDFECHIPYFHTVSGGVKAIVLPKKGNLTTLHNI